MKAIQIEAFGNPAEVVKAVDIPDVGAPAAAEVVIAVEASPINQYDLLISRAPPRIFVAEISGRLPTTIDGFVAKHREAFVGTARQRHTNGVVGPHSNPPYSQMTAWPRRPHERFVNPRP
jgi:NADPH:quinone reductase-like Zn-dependent oxidoreductase